MDEPENRSDENRSIAMDARDWIVRLTSGDVSEAELERFKAWRDASTFNYRAFERERVFWQGLHNLDSKPLQSTENLSLAHAPNALMRRRTFLAGSGMALAASVAAVGFPSMKLWWQADWKTGVGQQAQFSLPDGSSVLLNTNSAIKVDFQPDSRLVTLLQGEADFRVQPSHIARFRVVSQDGFSDALGTVFSVRSDAERTTVTVSEGQVRVTGSAISESVNTVLLRSDEQTQYSWGRAPEPARYIDLETELAWKTGRLIFDGRAFADVIEDIGRYVPERIVLGPHVPRDVPVSGVFSTSEMFPAIRALTRTQGLSVYRVPGVLIFIS